MGVGLPCVYYIRIERVHLAEKGGTSKTRNAAHTLADKTHGQHTRHQTMLGTGGA
jgi:hypothetical protein